MVNKSIKKLLKTQEVVDMVSMSAATIRKLEKTGEFPAHVKIGPRLNGWDAGEVNAWIKKIKKERK